MTVSESPMTLEGHCSAIYNNTLYVYTPYHFASIDLRHNAPWVPLTPGVPVTGAACVSAAIEGDNKNLAFYVVGGSGNASDYSGIQRYSYTDQKWSNLGSAPTAMSNLLSHGVGYLESEASILVYGGNKDTGGASQYTFLINTTTPYEVRSKNAQGAPPVADPMLLTWNQSAVALLGGSSSNTDIFIYVESGFTSSGVSLDSSLATALASTSRSALAIDEKGNKILQELNLNISPNTVTSYEMMKEGKPLNPATNMAASHTRRSFDKYPSYNDSDAPTSKKSDYSVAQGSNNLVVISSGSGHNTLSIFNQTSNSWVNATEFLGSNTQNVLHGTTTTTPTTSTTPTAAGSSSGLTSATSSSAAGGSAGSGEHVGVIIGATLGSICGAIVILVAILFFLRRARQKQTQGDQGLGGGVNDRLSFQDQGIEPLTDGAYPMAKSPVPVATVSDDSLAIMSGKYAEKSLKPPSQNYGYGLSKNSPLSTIPSSGVAPSSMYSDDSDRSAAVAAAVEAISSPGNKPGDRTTDEGWGKYFEDHSATNLAGMQSDRSTVSSVYTKSDYRGSAWPMANLAPLNFGFLDQPRPLGRVASGNPATENAGPADRSLVIPESQSARISSADSVSVLSDDDPHDTNWTGAGYSSWLGRPPSSNYSTSFYNSSNTNLPSANNQQGLARNSNGRKSSVIIPDDIEELPHSGTINSDMSWLNLHAER